MYLTNAQRTRLSARARASGVSEGEVIRGILDDALGLHGDEDARLAAVDETAGLSMPRPAPAAAEESGRPRPSRYQRKAGFNPGTIGKCSTFSVSRSASWTSAVAAMT